ncbi:competence protein ComGF [Evansella caseinilytica]|uniref:Competence protein ComGF n=1 Tax=Evansella caseinilytica TaxID=1503961 RepID=A0A1H3KSW1_9BACI|nr:competence type IV pilus minor pilin ComGF [Evansella caseinilytica]SDY55277.1 competence protein ComGF [Evansella caseinilytica]
MQDNMSDVLRNKSSAGMTMLELLISFAIFMIISSMVPLVFSCLTKPDVQTISHEEQTLFFFQLQLDFRSSSDFWTNEQGTILFFTRPADGAVIQYELYQDKVRRRVNNAGHEVFLQRVNDFQVQAEAFGISVEISGKGDFHRAVTIVHPRYFSNLSEVQDNNEK